MRGFYQNLYPIDAVVALLTCGGRFPLENVRFGFRYGEHCFQRYETFASRADAEAWMRHMEFPMEESIKKVIPLRFFSRDALLRYITEKAPDTINVQFPEDARPLVFDIDISDFVVPREHCACPPKSVCNVCWGEIMRPAMRKAKSLLEDLMGFEQVQFIFSGRKGFHIWVTDPRVWSFDLNARKNFLDRLGIPADREITIGRGHLIKLPWGKHQKTRQLCCTILDFETFVPNGARAS